MKRFVLILAGLSLISGCGKTDEPAPASASASKPAVGEVGSMPASGHVVSVSAGPDVGAVKNLAMVHPAFSLTPPDVTTPVIFATVENAEKQTQSPVVLKKIGDAWKIAEFTEAGNQEWVFAAICGPRKEAWGILDSASDEPADTLTLLRSTNEGSSWQFFVAVKKPVKEAAYSAFSMDKNGVGRLTEYLADDTDTTIHGYYHYVTSDAGKTWTGPTFEGDDVAEGDSLKDVDTIQEAMKKAETPPTQ